MPYKEVTAVCSKIHRKHLNHFKYTLWQNVEFLNVKAGCPHSNHWDLTFK